jgi:methanogenic corrinoid protein MtbC1
MSVLDDIRQTVIDGQIKVAPLKVKQADEGLRPDTILNEGLIAAMKGSGLFEQGAYFSRKCWFRRGL